MFTKLPPFKCSLVNKELAVIANSKESICLSYPDYSEGKPTNRADYAFNYRGKLYNVNHLHLTIAGDMVIFKTTEHNQVYTIIPGAEMNGYVVHKFIYNSELTQAGKNLIAKTVIEEINSWYRANKEAVLAGLKEEGKRRNQEEIDNIKAEIAALEEKKAELERKLEELE